MPNTSALVLGGGGARTAYQAGVLRYLAEAFPEQSFPIITASGMGALNAGLLAGRSQSWPDATQTVVETWSELRPRDVFEPRSFWDLVSQLVQHAPSAQQSLLDPAPLRTILAEALPLGEDGALTGIQQNMDDGWLEAVAVTTTHYASLNTVTWTQGRSMDGWPQARRSAETATLTLDHLLASAALTLVYPAVSIDEGWHGAGVGMLHPLSPALRLGADRVLALSTKSDPAGETEPEETYPSPLQVASILSNTLLLDTVDADAASMQRIDELARALPPEGRGGLKPTDVLVLRPSVDLTMVAQHLDVDVDASLGPVLQYLHGEGTRLPDLLSLLLFEPAYLRRLLLIGYTDAREQHERIEQFLREA
jgi:NTE family protein